MYILYVIGCDIEKQIKKIGLRSPRIFGEPKTGVKIYKDSFYFENLSAAF